MIDTPEKPTRCDHCGRECVNLQPCPFTLLWFCADTHECNQRHIAAMSPAAYSYYEFLKVLASPVLVMFTEN